MAEIDVTAVGEALVDLIAPDAADLEVATHFIRLAGGAPANVAVAVARLGGKSALLGAVGDDPFGRHLRGILEENGVNTAGLLRVPQRTTAAFVARSHGGIPDYVFYRGSDAVFRAEELTGELITGAAFVHLSSMALLSEPSRSATLQAAALAHGGETLVSVDPNLRPSSWPSLNAARSGIEPLLGAADVLKVNEEEARLLTGRGNVEEALDALSTHDRLVVATRGADGCIWCWHGQTGHVVAPEVEVVDTTGAGDAFAGALLIDLCARNWTGVRFPSLPIDELEAVLRFACAAGALACRVPGAMAALPRRHEVEELL